jgi:hypothetical protein
VTRLLRTAARLALAGGVLAGVAAWGALAPVPADSREQVFEIPKGTWARRTAGEKTDTLPSTIHLTLGVKDVLVLRNLDAVPQMFGPVLIMPEQSFRLPFRVASSHQFACTAHVSGTLTVEVAPEPSAGWRRLSWRVAQLFRSGMAEPRPT